MLLSLLFAGTATAAVEEIASFTYQARGMALALPIHGHRPADAGSHPVFVYVAATQAWNAAAQYMTAQMAERGFVAVSVDYTTRDFYPLSCEMLTQSVRQIFDVGDPSSAINAVAELPGVDIAKGIVVSGFSLGGNVAVLAKNFDPGVRAAFVTGHGYQAWGEACYTIGKIALPRNRIRSAMGADDTFFLGNSSQNRQMLEATTGWSCGTQATQCIAPNGSGWWLVSSAEAPSGNSAHCFAYVGADCNADFDLSFRTSSAWWALPANFEWLAKFASSPPSLVSALLPGSRSVQVGHPATVFATAINTTSDALSGCTIGPRTSVPANFSFQATDAANALTGVANEPVEIPAQGNQTFVLSLTPTTAFAPTDVEFDFECLQGGPGDHRAGPEHIGGERLGCAGSGHHRVDDGGGSPDQRRR